jgi:GTP pyrophosphokinase
MYRIGEKRIQDTGPVDDAGRYAMVKLTDLGRNITSKQWLETLSARLSPVERDLVISADTWAQLHYSDRVHPSGQPWANHVRGGTGILGSLRVGGEALAAMMLLGAPIATRLERDALQAAFGPTVLALVEGVASMAQIQGLRSNAAGAKTADRASQLEALRKMFLAMAQDVRIVLIKLADQVQWLHELASNEDADAREDAAQEALELFSPLANRLGVWQLKWELEDLAFRCLEPDVYRDLARQLDEKRRDRETYIAEVIGMLRAELETAGITAEVSGRPKHIYSIWRKMQQKGIGLEDLFDVRAVRVMVEDVRNCYAVLGVVHNIWTPIPREFDDYIARPKANQYRSLHTAVIGPDRKVLEVQVRTHEMHQHAELGVAAHWRYKESVKGDKALDDKIAWLRSVLEWKDEIAESGELARYFNTDLFQDMVYVITPQGRVVDLPRGSTPVDFAYHLHSELGHHCRGAKVNGQIVPLTYALSNGQRVEIIAAKEGGPSRDWLNPVLGYLKSNRARAKVRQWFNNQQLNEAISHGRALLDKDLQRLGKTGQNLEQLASQLEFGDVNEMFAALGRGELAARQLQAAVLGEPVAEAKSPLPPEVVLPSAPRSGILIVGVDKLLTVLARCCKPAPPDRIIGFVTRGRGVTVHRVDCRNVSRLPQERLIASDWGKTGESKFPVDIEVIAGSHPASMRDILDIFTREKVRVASSVSHNHDLNAKMAFTLEIEGLPQLARLLTAVRAVAGVVSARRK